jgi:hypothetical protein
MLLTQSQRLHLSVTAVTHATGELRDAGTWDDLECTCMTERHWACMQQEC